MSNSTFKRLQQDLKQLKEDPIVGANAEPFDDKDLTVWYGIVLGSEGPLTGIPIRFCLEFPNDYPNNPPKAYFETFISYSQGAAMKDARGRIEVCLNIFGNFGMVHTEWATESSGWSPSYTVSTILISVQALMMGDMLSKDVESVGKMINSALEFQCNETGHQGSDSTKWFPQIITDPEVAKAISDKYRKPNRTLLDTFYICYANRDKTGGNSHLGYGIHFENPRNGMMSSPCEYLSEDSFTQGQVRRSSTNKPFEHWLPILIRSQDWVTNPQRLIKQKFLRSIETICDAIGFRNQLEFSKVFKVCASLMNGLVVDIMNNMDNVTANDKFINGYFAIYRLLFEYSKGCPELVKHADKSLASFKSDPKSRTKACCPNLGEFLIYLTISKNHDWSDISQVLLAECDTRNVFWYAVGNRNNPSRYPELKNPGYKDPERCSKVFQATNVSRNLIMFQIRFAIVAKMLNVSGLLDEENSYGLAPEALRAELKELYTKVLNVKNWNEYFEFLEMPTKTDAERDRELVQAVKSSASQGYHR